MIEIARVTESGYVTMELDDAVVEDGGRRFSSSCSRPDYDFALMVQIGDVRSPVAKFRVGFPWRHVWWAFSLGASVGGLLAWWLT